MSTNAPNRRDLFAWSVSGLTGTAFTSLLLNENRAENRDENRAVAAGVMGEATDPPPHLPPKVKRVIHICLLGGLSHLDSFDHKPELTKHHGKRLPSTEAPTTFFGQVGLLRGSDWSFQQRGQSGLWVSELFPHMAELADDLTVIRSMLADSPNHTPATFQQNTGFRLNGFPVMGSWISYGLGCVTDELPAYVVLPDPRGLPAGSTINWSNGFLPARHQGVAFRTNGRAPIDDLQPTNTVNAETESASRELLATMNRRHAADRGDDLLTARLRSYELAAKMQLAVPKVTDLSRETELTRKQYGLDRPATADFGRSCLLARRLLEHGVRFVQLFSGGSFGSPRINWDGHENMKENHAQEALRIDQPTAALLRDLKQRGMWNDTLVLFTTEFGRTPFTQSAANTVGTGRDHNHLAFSVWLAGGGVKRGLAYGSTDEFGWKSVEKIVTWPDFHATVLQLLGIDHERLTYYHNGIRRRLTNVHGQVVRDILA